MAEQQQQHFHTLSPLSRPSLWSIGLVLLSSGTIGTVVRKERGNEWSFRGPYKASSFLLDEATASLLASLSGRADTHE